MVQMFTGRAELLDKGETTAEHSKNQKDEADKLDDDKANTNPSSGGLFGGLFKPKAPALKPVVDIEDGVMRCPHCNWELEDDEICGGCGWYYRPDSDQMTDYSDDYSDEDSMDDLEDPDSLDDEFEDEDDFGDRSFPHLPFFGPGAGSLRIIRGDPATLPHHIHSMFHPGHGPLEYNFYSDSPASRGDVNGWTSEQDEEDEMGSFIDDDEHGITSQAIDYDSDPSTVVGEPRASNQDPGPLREYTIDAVLTDDSDDDDYGSEIDPGSQTRREGSFTPVSRSSPVNPMYYETRSSPGQSEAGTTDVSRLDEEPLGSSEEEDDESDSETSSSPPPRRVQRPRDTGTSAGNAIAIDDSDDEDDQPVGPLRTAQRRRPRYSPY